MTSSDIGAAEFDGAYAEEQLRRSRHPFRRFVKNFYLRNILRDVRGATIDFGCGAGQLLAQLPTGSVGLEVNPHLIKELILAGFDVRQATGAMTDFDLGQFEPGRYETLVISHVLEHLADPIAAVTRLLAAAERLRVGRIIVIVPGAKGFASDRTHLTFINRDYLELHVSRGGIATYRQTRLSYFPGPWEWVGKYFVFHEMKVVYDRSVGR
jgi:SAM-dependent methyltransferase